MAAAGYKVREFCKDDDFDYFDRLAWEEHERRNIHVGIRKSGEFPFDKMKLVKRETYFNNEDSSMAKESKGFVLMTDVGEFAGFATVTISPSGNGTITQFGHPDQNQRELGPLIDACLEYVRQRRGNKLFCMTEILPGQIYNAEFEFWSRYAFKPESYYSQWLIFNDFKQWNVPADLDISHVLTASSLDLTEIESILREDGEDFIAESVRFDFAELTPDHVFLKLIDPVDGKINGIAYYQVNRDQGMLGTNTLGIHIRSQISYQEIQRFVRCVLTSMNQLNLSYAGTRMSSRNLSAMIAMCAEGFTLAPMGQVVFYRPV